MHNIINGFGYMVAVFVFLFSRATGWERMMEFCTFLYWRMLGVLLWYSSLTWEKCSSTKSELITSGLIINCDVSASSATPLREHCMSHRHSVVGFSSGKSLKLHSSKNAAIRLRSEMFCGWSVFCPPS